MPPIDGGEARRATAATPPISTVRRVEFRGYDAGALEKAKRRLPDI